MYHYIEPYYADDHPDPDRHISTSLDVLDATCNCPIMMGLGQEKNEVGEGCDGCARHDPDRASLCLHMQLGLPIIISPDLEVFFKGG